MTGPIWYDKKLMHLSTDEIVAHINKVGREQGFTKEWTKDSLYRTFKGRGIPAGPKAQLKK